MPSFCISFHQGYCFLKNCSGAHSFCITFSYISSCSVGELQANTGAVITYTLYMGVTHKEGETTPNGVEETFDHKCFETLLLTPAQRLSLLLISLSAAEKQHFSFNMRGNSWDAGESLLSICSSCGWPLPGSSPKPGISANEPYQEA